MALKRFLGRSEKNNVWKELLNAGWSFIRAHTFLRKEKEEDERNTWLNIPLCF